MANDNIKVMGGLELQSTLSFEQNYTDFPANPKPRTLVVKDGIPYLYTELVNGSGFFSWLPVGHKNATYVHVQGIASTTWTVTHNFGTTNFGYFVYDENHHMVGAQVEVLSDNQVRITLTQAITGTAVFFSVETIFAQAVNASADLTVGNLTIRDTNGIMSVNNSLVAMADGVYSKDQVDQFVAALGGSLTTSATDAQTYTDAKVANEAADRAAADTALEAAIAAEAAARVANVATLQTQVDSILTNTDAVALNSIAEVVTAFHNADDSLNGAITALGTGLQSDLADEVTRATAAEQSLVSSIATLAASSQSYTDAAVASEAADRAAADSVISASLTAETSARTAADTALSTRVTAVESQVNGKIGNVADLTTSSTATIVSAINSLDADLASETSARISADQQLSSDIASEAARAQSAESTLQSSVTTLASSVGKLTNSMRTLSLSETTTASYAPFGASLTVDGDTINLRTNDKLVLDVQASMMVMSNPDGSLSVTMVPVDTTWVAPSGLNNITNAAIVIQTPSTVYASPAVIITSMMGSPVLSVQFTPLSPSMITGINPLMGSPYARVTITSAPTLLSSISMHSLVADTVGQAAQPAITSVGALTSLTMAGDIMPATHGVSNIGSSTNKFKAIHVQEAYLDASTLYVDGTPVIHSTTETIQISADPNQGIRVATTGTGHTTLDSQASTIIQTSGQNADVVIQAGGQGSMVRATSASEVRLTAPTVSIVGDATVSANLTVTGNLDIKGNVTYIESTQTQIKDNIITLNKGELGSGVSLRYSGVDIDRGDLARARIVWDETNSKWFAGVVGSENALVTMSDVQAAVASAAAPDTANTVTASAQPNITSVGTLTSLNVTGTVTAGLFAGSGANLTAIAGANVTGTVANATFATSAGSVAGANVTGTVANATYATSAGSATDGVVTTGSYANPAWITSLAGSKVTGTVANATFATSAGSVAGDNVTGVVANATYAVTAGSVSSIAGANVTGTVANATFATSAGSVAGANVTGTVANATYAVTAGSVSSIAGANVTGTVANATYATTAGSVSSIAGANVTGTVANATYATTAGSVSSIAGANVTGTVANATYAVTADVVGNAAQPNITSVSTVLSVGTVSIASGVISRSNGDLSLRGGGSQVQRAGITMSNSGGTAIFGGSTTANVATTGYGISLQGGDGEVRVTKTTAANSTSTGALIVAGGVGVAGNVYSAALVTSGDVTVGGNLIVQGTQTTINATTVSVSDLNITVAKDAANATAANGAGITVAGANATMVYTSSTDTWNFNKSLVGTISNATLAATANVVSDAYQPNITQLSGTVGIGTAPGFAAALTVNTASGGVRITDGSATTYIDSLQVETGTVLSSTVIQGQWMTETVDTVVPTNTTDVTVYQYPMTGSGCSRSAKLLVEIQQGTKCQVAEVLMMWNATGVTFTVYATMDTDGELVSFAANKAGNYAYITVTPLNLTVSTDVTVFATRQRY